MTKDIISELIEYQKKGYISFSTRNLSKMLEDCYDNVSRDIHGYRNSKRLNDFYKISECLSEKQKDHFDAYIKLYFDVKLSGGEVRMIKERDLEKSKFVISGEEDWIKKENVISFYNFMRLREKFGSIDREILINIYDLFKTNINSEIKKSLRWPSIEVSRSLQSIFDKGWMTTGLLKYEGYHVGNIGLPAEKRISILDSILQKNYTLEKDFFDDLYIEQWGEPKSIDRLLKLARTIAALCRNAKRSSFNYEVAISDWGSDLNYLKCKYYDPLIISIDEYQWPQ